MVFRWIFGMVFWGYFLLLCCYGSDLVGCLIGRWGVLNFYWMLVCGYVFGILGWVLEDVFGFVGGW